ncbi:plastocyanin [Microdochium nivale]|nr:plastocyanin [Microdochium nivale]
MLSNSINALLLATATLAAAKTITVQVGSSGLNYSPESATAAVGDTIDFVFKGRSHDVVQGAFDKPCQAVTQGGFNSGFFADATSSAAKTFRVTVNSTDPIWYYCSAPGHCQGGMVGVINPPAVGNTLASYKSGAAGASNSVTPPNVFGGTVVNGAGGGTGGASSSAGSPAPTGSSTGSPAGSPSGTTAAGGSSTTTPNAAASYGQRAGQIGALVAGLGAAFLML